MAVGTNFNLDFGFRGANRKSVSARASNFGRGIIFRVDICFHGCFYIIALMDDSINIPRKLASGGLKFVMIKNKAGTMRRPNAMDVKLAG